MEKAPNLLEGIFESTAKTLPESIIRAGIRQDIAAPVIAKMKNLPEDVQRHLLTRGGQTAAGRVLVHNSVHDALLRHVPHGVISNAIYLISESSKPAEVANRLLKLILTRDEVTQRALNSQIKSDLLPLVTDTELLIQWLYLRFAVESTDERAARIEGVVANLSVAETEEQLFKAPPIVRLELLRFPVSPVLAAESALDLVRSDLFPVKRVVQHFIAPEKEFPFRAAAVRDIAAQGKAMPEGWELLTQRPTSDEAWRLLPWRAQTEFDWRRVGLRTSPDAQFTDRVEDVALGVRYFKETGKLASSWVTRMVTNAVTNPYIPAQLRQETLTILRDVKSLDGLWDVAVVETHVRRIDPRERFPEEPETWDLWCDVFPEALLKNGNVEIFGGESGLISRFPLWGDQHGSPYWEYLRTVTPTPKLIGALPLTGLTWLAANRPEWAEAIGRELGRLYDESGDEYTTIETLLRSTADTLRFEEFAAAVKAVIS